VEEECQAIHFEDYKHELKFDKKFKTVKTSGKVDFKLGSSKDQLSYYEQFKLDRGGEHGMMPN
jgi:hypothetical protein